MACARLALATLTFANQGNFAHASSRSRAIARETKKRQFIEPSEIELPILDARGRKGSRALVKWQWVDPVKLYRALLAYDEACPRSRVYVCSCSILFYCIHTSARALSRQSCFPFVFVRGCCSQLLAMQSRTFGLPFRGHEAPPPRPSVNRVLDAPCTYHLQAFELLFVTRPCQASPCLKRPHGG